MKKKKFKVRDFSSIHGFSKMNEAEFDTAKEALKLAGKLSTLFWHRRVEVWKGNFRLLLAVH